MSDEPKNLKQALDNIRRDLSPLREDGNLYDELVDLRNEERSAGMIDWMPIETAPELDKVLLTDGRVIVIAYHGDGSSKHLFGWIDEQTRSAIFFTPTHWMPLPEPPQGEQG